MIRTEAISQAKRILANLVHYRKGSHYDDDLDTIASALMRVAYINAQPAYVPDDNLKDLFNEITGLAMKGLGLLEGKNL